MKYPSSPPKNYLFFKNNNIAKKFYRTNNQITAPQVHLIDDQGNSLGKVNLSEALKIAQDKRLDLVEISPKTNPPIAKILDFGEFKYTLKKKNQASKIKQKKTETKTIRLSLRIGQHDIDLRMKQAIKFLQKGHKIKIEAILRGRERAHRDLMREKIEQFSEVINQTVPVQKEQSISKMSNQISLLIYKK